MGWGSGARVFSKIIDAVQPHVESAEARKAIYEPIIQAFSDQDWDTQLECLGKDPVYDELIREMYPDMFEYEDEE